MASPTLAEHSFLERYEYLELVQAPFTQSFALAGFLMQTLNSTPAADRSGLDELTLRVCGTARDGQIVKLSAAKCTIGSGERCTLRLRARHVRPLHCLILRDARGMAVRCWSPDTRLNGRRFDDAPLVPGDRLSCGPIELEVLGPELRGTEPSTSRDATTPRVDPDSSLEAERRHWDQERRSIEEALARQQADFEQRQHEWNQRATEVDAAIAARTAHLDERQSEIAIRSDTLEAERKALQAEREQLECRHREIDQRSQRADTTHNDFEGERAALEQDRQKLADLQSSLEADRSVLDQQQRETAETDAKHQETKRSLADLETRLQAERDALAKERTTWEAHCREQEHQRAEQQQGFESNRKSLERQLAELETQVQQLQAEQALGQQSKQESARFQEQIDALQRQLEQQQQQFSARQAELNSAQAEAASQLQELEQAREQLKQYENASAEHKQELASLRETLTAAEAKLGQQRDADETSRKSAAEELLRRESELERREAELQQQRAVFEADTANQDKRPNDAARQEQEASLAAAREALEAEQREWAATRQREEEIVNRQNDTLDRRLAELRAGSAALEHERAQFAEQQEEHLAEIANQDQAVAARLQELEQLSAQFVNSADESASAARPAPFASHDAEEDTGTLECEDLDSEEEKPHEDNSVSAILARWQGQTTSSEDSTDSEARQPEPEQSAFEEITPVAPRRAARAAEPQLGEEDSIESYMAALMNRVRGGDNKVAHAPPRELPTPSRDKQSEEPVEKAETPRPQEQETIQQPSEDILLPQAPAELERRRQGPELSDLAAMRQLANQQARSAIHVHGQKRSIKQILYLSSASVGSLLLTLTILNITSHDDRTIRTGIMAGSVLSVYWAFRALIASGQYFHALHHVVQLSKELRMNDAGASPIAELGTAAVAVEPATSDNSARVRGELGAIRDDRSSQFDEAEPAERPAQ